MALIAVALLGGEGLWSHPFASFVLPPVEPTDDRGHVGVAQLLHGLGGEGRPGPTGAVHDHVAGLVGDPPLHRGLEGAPRDVHGSGQGALLVLVGLTDIEDHCGTGGDLLGGLGRLDLSNGRLGVGQHLPERGHGDHDPSSSALVLHRLSHRRGSRLPPTDRTLRLQVKQYQRGQHSRGPVACAHGATMELTEAIASRRMTRNFAGRSIDRGMVDSLLRDALRAPSAGNAQGRRIRGARRS